MRIEEFRSQFPEYADLPDDEVMDVIGGKEIEEETAPEDVNAIGVVDALDTVTAALKTANKTLSAIANKTGKEEKDMTPHFMALGAQLQKIEAAINKLAALEAAPMPAVAEPKLCKLFKIKRDEIGDIESVIPVY